MPKSCDQAYTQLDLNHPPPPLMTSEPGSFARNTLAVRKPAIIQTVLEDHAGLYPEPIVQAVTALHDEVQQGQPIRPLRQATAPDTAHWTEAWQGHPHDSWLATPWYFAEVFFYRRLLEAVGYFGFPGGNGAALSEEEARRWSGRDPFGPRKQAELNSEVPWQILELALAESADSSPESFRALLHLCIWGNRVDLSHAHLARSVTGIALDSEQANLVVDQTEAVLAHLQDRPAGRPVYVDFISDNSGTELLMDLALTDFLLRQGWADRVTMHLKAHPTFVSDTMPVDVETTLAAMKARPNADFVALAGRLEKFREEERFLLRADFYWNSSFFFWQLPSAIESQLSQARLVILKGDANYRRLLGDSRCWPTTIPAAQAIPYFPAPLVALRTLKSEPIVGLQPGQAEALDREDPDWQVNGRRGMIQFVGRGVEPQRSQATPKGKI